MIRPPFASVAALAALVASCAHAPPTYQEDWRGTGYSLISTTDTRWVNAECWREGARDDEGGALGQWGADYCGCADHARRLVFVARRFECDTARTMDHEECHARGVLSRAECHARFPAVRPAFTNEIRPIGR